MAAFASNADLLKYFDTRVVGDLAGDTGVRVSAGSLATDANVTAALEAASGKVAAAVMQGQRYSSDDLAGLTGNSLGYLKYLTCVVAFSILWERRPWSEDREKAAERADEMLEMLRTGKHVFDVEDHKDAGLPSIDGPSRVAIRDLNLIVDRARGHYYPARVTPHNR